MAADKIFSKYPANPTCTVVIATSTTISSAVDLGNKRLVGMYVPSTFDGTALKIATSDTLTGTYVNLIDATGADITFTVAASKYFGLNDVQQSQVEGIRYFKIVTSTAQTTTDTIFTLATVPR